MQLPRNQAPEIVGASHQAGTSNTAGIISAVGSGLSNIAASIFGPKNVVAPASTTPAWLMPVAIGGIGIIALAIFAKKK